MANKITIYYEKNGASIEMFLDGPGMAAGAIHDALVTGEPPYTDNPVNQIVIDVDVDLPEAR